MEEAHASVRNLTSLIYQVLRSNLDMSRRLRNLEMMHPALAASIIESTNTERREEAQRTSHFFEFAFEEDLQISRVYRRAALYGSKKLSVLSSNASFALSCLSCLSLSDVSNVCAIALPISSRELWNHHRYSQDLAAMAGFSSSRFDTWYNPSPKVANPQHFYVFRPGPQADNASRKLRS